MGITPHERPVAEDELDFVCETRDELAGDCTCYLVLPMSLDGYLRPSCPDAHRALIRKSYSTGRSSAVQIR